MSLIEYKIGDIVEVDRGFGRSIFVRIFEISKVSKSIYEDRIGKKIYKGAKIPGNDIGISDVEFYDNEIKTIYRKVDLG